MGRGQTEVNRSWEEVDSSPHEWPQGIQDFSERNNCRELELELETDFSDVDHFSSLDWICYNIASVLCFCFFGYEACHSSWPGIGIGAWKYK